MENKIAEIVNRASKSVDNYTQFAKFVNETELFAEQNPHIFINNEMCSYYSNVWAEMEIVNALALCEWEERGKPKDFNKVWEHAYIDDAKEVVQEFIQYIKNL